MAEVQVGIFCGLIAARTVTNVFVIGNEQQEVFVARVLTDVVGRA